MTEKKPERQAEQPDEERRSGAEPVLIGAAERRIRQSARMVQRKARAAVDFFELRGEMEGRACN
jgi:hypothetical protein